MKTDNDVSSVGAAREQPLHFYLRRTLRIYVVLLTFRTGELTHITVCLYPVEKLGKGFFIVCMTERPGETKVIDEFGPVKIVE
jgi:hypothetical protein